MTSPYIFDVFFAVVLVFMFIQGRRKGAFRVIAGLFGTIAAWVGSVIISPSVTPFTVKLITPFASSTVSSAAESMGLSHILSSAAETGTGSFGGASALLTLSEKLSALGLPKQLTALAEKLRITSTLDSVLTEAAPASETPAELLTSAITEKLAPVITFLAVFILIKLAISFAVKLLSLDWPIISTLNHLAGGAIGLLGGAVIILAVCAGIFAFGSSEEAGLTSSYMLSQSFTGSLLSAFMNK